MNIVVNTRLLLTNKLEGIGWFTYETLKRITKSHSEHQFYFVFDRPYDQQFIFSDNVTPVVIGPQARHPILYHWWFQVSIPKVLKRVKADVFISPDGYIPLKSTVPCLSVIHDLNFEHYPKWVPAMERKYYRKFFPKFASQAKRIATVSNYSKKDISDKYGVPLSKIDVVHNGASEVFKPQSNEVKQAIQLQYTDNQDYFVFVGSINPRKNLNGLLRSFELFKNQTTSSIKLLVVGEKMWKDSLETENESVVFTGRLDQEELAKVTGSALAMINLSFFEGFGIPILESMKSGVPVIASNRTSFPEIGGDAVVLVNPDNHQEVVDAMEKVVKDEGWRNQKIALGIARAAEFSWDNTAKLLWKSIVNTISS